MNQTLHHRGYDDSVEYSAEDKVLHGRVLGIRDLISYGGTTVRNIEKNFCDAVDEYLDFCQRRSKEPNTPFRGSFNVRVSSELHKQASLYADQHDMKLNTVVQHALREFLSHAE